MSKHGKLNEKGQLMDETGKTLWQQLNRGYDASRDNDHLNPILRYKAPYNKTTTHDMYGDAVQLVVDSIMNIDMPYYVAYVVGIDMINKKKDELNITVADFVEDADVKIIENVGNWTKKINDLVPTYCKQFVRGEIKINDRTPVWYQLRVSCFSSKGKRKSQEDKYICLPSIDVHNPGVKPDIPLLAVFDGHNGSQVATYAAAHLPFEFGAALRKHSKVGTALTSAMQRLDRRLECRSSVENWRSIGATAVIASVSPKEIHLRWLGDSSAFIFHHPSNVKQLTTNHNASLQSEVERVSLAGGEFIWRDGESRLQGVLSVSRALGDYSFRPALSGVPEELIVPRTKEQYLLILVCDGITDVFTTKDLQEQVENYIQENDSDEYAEMAHHIVEAAVHNGSSDNCTCVIAFLRPPDELWKLYEDNDNSD